MKTIGADQMRVQRALLNGFLILITVVLTYVGFTRNMLSLGLLIPLIAVVALFLGRPEMIFFTILFAQNAQLLIPGITGSLGISGLFQVLLIGWVILDKSIKKQKRPFSFRKSPDLWMVVFFINLLLIMAVRGSGFAMLGSSVYGGAGYIMLFLAIATYFAAVQVKLQEKHVKILLWMVLIGALVPALVQIIGSFAPAASGWMTKFVQASFEGIVEERLSADGLVRWSAFGGVSYALLPMAYVLCQKKGVRGAIICLAVLLVGMTGFRSRLFQLGMLVFLASLYYSKNRMKVLILWGCAGVVVLGLLMTAAPILPRAVQRAVSFIPFITVDAAIAERAANSSNWRFDLWRDYCIPNVPQYLLIGRGIAQDITQFAWLNASWYGSSEFFYYMGRYHSGPFSLLLDFGLCGTLSFTLFFILTLSDSWKTMKRYAIHQDSRVARYYVFLTLFLSFQIFSYYFIFGDVRSDLSILLMNAVQLRILKKNFLMESPLEGGVQALSASGRSAFGGKPANAVNRWARPS